MTNEQLLFSDELFVMPENPLSLAISYEFLMEHITLDWDRLYFGLKSAYIPLDYAVKKALEEVSSGEQSDTVLALASIFKGEDALAVQYVEDLVAEHVISRALLTDETHMLRCKNQFLYVAMLWLYENRDDYNQSINFEEPFQPFEYNLKVYDVLYDFKLPSLVAEEFYRFTITYQVTADNKKGYLTAWEQFLSEQKLIATQRG